MESGSITKIIDRKLNSLFDEFLDRELSKVLNSQDEVRLANFFNQHLTQAPTFGDYIYLYLFNNTSLKEQYENYKVVPAEIYYKGYISKAFEERLGKRRGSLNPCSKESLSAKKVILEGKRMPSREEVFLFAFGLGMDVETVSLILKKCLMESDFNMRSYREVIYYWCLKHHIPYGQMLTWLEYYEGIDTDKDTNKKRLTDVKNTGTGVLVDKVRYQFRDEEDVRSYLISLKKTDPAGLIRKSAKETFKTLFRSFPRAFVPGEDDSDENDTGKIVTSGIQEETSSDGKDVEKQQKQWKQDERYSRYLPEEVGIRVLNQIREDCYRQNQDVLLHPSVLKYLFQDVHFTEKMVRDRIYGTTSVSRRELITADFIVYMIGLLDDEMAEKCETEGTRRVTYEDRWDSLIDFEEQVSDLLEELGMERFYVRNPYELFLVFCLMHRDPFAYFMASWEGSYVLEG